MFNFADDASQPFTAEDARTALFTGPRSVNAFYQEESRGRLGLTGRDSTAGDIYGWVTIPSSKAGCDTARIVAWTRQATEALAAQGVSLAGYEHVVYVHPSTSCGWAGIASVGGAWSAFNGTLALWVAGHEIGHNYGFEHAGKAYCRSGATPVSMVADFSTCNLTKEYDDPYDIMGNREQRHSQAVYQRQAGWMPAESVRTVTASTTVTLTPSNESASGAVQAIRIPRGDALPDGSGGSRSLSYWLEFRRPAGGFDDFSATDPVVNGVTIRVAGPEHDPGTTWLIDTNPGNAWHVKDEPLTAGRTFEDPYRRIWITTEAITAAGAQVRVDIGAAPAPAPAAAPAPARTAPARDTNAPSVPGAPRAKAAPRGVQLEWAPSTDDTQVAGYRIFRNGSVRGTTAVPSFLSARDRTGTWRVAAYDAAGNVSALSAPVTVRATAARRGRPAGARDASSRRRLAPRRVVSSGRRLAVARLATADGRGIRVRSQARAAFETRFAPAAGALGASAVKLRLRAPRPCDVTVSVRGAGGWRVVGRAPVGRRFSTVSLRVPAMRTDGTLDLRTGCAGAGHELQADLAALLV
jgi:hypothetical protein